MFFHRCLSVIQFPSLLPGSFWGGGVWIGTQGGRYTGGGGRYPGMGVGMGGQYPGQCRYPGGRYPRDIGIPGDRYRGGGRYPGGVVYLPPLRYLPTPPNQNRYG